jgi:UDP-glucuronate 4-epimerase
MGSHLVTGAAGFIGYHLCESLLAKGHYVLGVDNLNDYYDMQLKRDRLARLRRHAQFLFGRLDLSDRVAVAQLFSDARFDVIYHMAAQAGIRYSMENPYAYIDSNVVAFVNILECCRHNPPDHFVYASSSSVYGANKKVPFAVDDPVEQPMSLYAATKRSNELFAYAYSHLYGLKITGLRFFTVYGPWGRPDMAVYKFTRAMLAGEPIDVYNHGDMRRDFTYIDDVIAGILQVGRRSGGSNGSDTNKKCRLYNIGSNHPIDLRELITTLEECLGVKAKLRYHAMQPGEVPETYADIDASKRDLNFKPSTALRRGVEKFVEWYRDYHRVAATGAPRTALVDSGNAP